MRGSRFSSRFIDALIRLVNRWLEPWRNYINGQFMHPCIQPDMFFFLHSFEDYCPAIPRCFWSLLAIFNRGFSLANFRPLVQIWRFCFFLQYIVFSTRFFTRSGWMNCCDLWRKLIGNKIWNQYSKVIEVFLTSIHVSRSGKITI